ncbi:hypothetical protein Misp03_80980 [Microbispora sp. NBRC 16548]|nr:hypothetical protein Misp03_80980 [Microbispora sp. NBRC 16548]
MTARRAVSHSLTYDPAAPAAIAPNTADTNRTASGHVEGAHGITAATTPAAISSSKNLNGRPRYLSPMTLGSRPTEINKREHGQLRRDRDLAPAPILRFSTQDWLERPEL